MKKFCAPFCVISLLLFMVACNNIQIIKEPKTSIGAHISRLSEEQFDEVGTDGIENPTKDDFRNFTIHFKMEDLLETSAKVVFPDQVSWKQAINSVDEKDRYWFGENNNQNNSKNSTNYNNDFVFYSKGLSEDEIKKAFEKIIFTVSWKTEKGNIDKKEYRVSDFIIFDNNK